MLATTLTEIKDYATIIGFIFTCIGVVILVFKAFTDPDKKADKIIAINNATCVQKHTRIDEIFKEVKDEIKSINYTFAHFKENEFRHIEDSTNAINVKIAGIDGKIDTLVGLVTNSKQNNIINK